MPGFHRQLRVGEARILMRNGLLACLTEEATAEATAENDARVACENNGIDWSARMPALKNFFLEFSWWSITFAS